MAMPRAGWMVEFHGGAYDGWEGRSNHVRPPRVLIVWEHRESKSCPGHVTDDPHDPLIDLRTCESYRRVEMDFGERRAVYQVGEDSPDRDAEVEERELVGAGASDLGHGWPVSA